MTTLSIFGDFANSNVANWINSDFSYNSTMFVEEKKIRRKTFPVRPRRLDIFKFITAGADRALSAIESKIEGLVSGKLALTIPRSTENPETIFLSKVLAEKAEFSTQAQFSHVSKLVADPKDSEPDLNLRFELPGSDRQITNHDWQDGFIIPTAARHTFDFTSDSQQSAATSHDRHVRNIAPAGLWEKYKVRAEELFLGFQTAGMRIEALVYARDDELLIEIGPSSRSIAIVLNDEGVLLMFRKNDFSAVSAFVSKSYDAVSEIDYGWCVKEYGVPQEWRVQKKVTSIKSQFSAVGLVERQKVLLLTS